VIKRISSVSLTILATSCTSNLNISDKNLYSIKQANSPHFLLDIPGCDDHGNIIRTLTIALDSNLHLDLSPLLAGEELRTKFSKHTTSPWSLRTGTNLLGGEGHPGSDSAGATLYAKVSPL
jgi:hypothetical protein